MILTRKVAPRTASMGNGKSERAGNSRKGRSLVSVFLLPDVCAGLAGKPTQTMDPENVQASQRKPECVGPLAKPPD